MRHTNWKFWAIACCTSLYPLCAQAHTEEMTERLRARIEIAAPTTGLQVGSEVIHASVALPEFYQRRIYRPAWIGDEGPRPYVRELVEAIEDAHLEGLNPEDYHLRRIRNALETLRGDRALNAGLLVDLELLLTDAFMVYGSHLLSGRVNPETFDAEWLANRRGADFATVLQQALDAGRIREALAALRPPHEGYDHMKKALARYRGLAQADGWPRIPAGGKLEVGAQGARVALLRVRLELAGDLAAEADAPDVFDDALAQGVRRFQHRHGLEPDGIVGPATLRTLNTPVEQRLEQVVRNLERWRWLPQDLGRRHILVNIANFELDVVEEGRVVMMMRAIVGRPYRRTPVFSGAMTYLVFSPFWHVPPSIAVRDMLPQLRQNSAYFDDKAIRVFQGWGDQTREIDPKSVDWTAIPAQSFPYRFRQDPGPSNALGRVKFMFPNTFHVYLHDTPSRDLFEKTVRHFSSGCIRVEKPLELAEYLLQDNPRWTREHIAEVVNRPQEQTVSLARAIPVHLLYWTAWADDAGSIHFREDIYGRDARLDAALRQKPPVAMP